MKSAWAIRALCFFLIAIGLVYLIHGSHELFTQARDYHLRWVEEHYVFRGKNPADVYARIVAEKNHQPVPWTPRDNTIERDLDPDATEAINGTYPLYAYFTGAFLTWPPTLQTGRIYNGVLNLVVLAVLLIWAHRLGRAEGPRFALLLTASVFAVNSISSTFIVGQYGLLVIIALVGAAHLDEKEHWILAGLCFGFAMIKPSMTAPFALPFLIMGRWKMLTVAGAYVAVASLVMWPILKTSPLESLHQMGAGAVYFGDVGYSLNNYLEMAGLGPQMALRAAAIIALGATLVLLWFWRTSSVWTLFAIAAMGSRFWTYHRFYDNIILLFLLMALAVAAWRTPTALRVAAYLLLGFSLWMPGRLTDYAWWTSMQVVIWVAALAVLLFSERKGPQAMRHFLPGAQQSFSS